RIVVGGLGLLYDWPLHTNALAYRGLLRDVENVPSVDPILLKGRPWFAALMGFATLGLTDMVEPHNRWGALALVADVLAGFSTLGLFIAVFQNKFARRS